VVASHGRDEELALAAALTAGVPYVGLVASRKRGAAVAASLDVSDDDRARLHTPAGIDIGARTPEEIALSILAEIISARRAMKAPVSVAPAPAPASADHEHGEGHCCHE
jgi:xanthine dehydrogenase accessory factor